MDAGGKRVGRVAGQDRAGRLEDDAALVVMFIYIMYGNPRFRLTGGKDGLVYVVAVHPFSPEFGQKRWMDVDDVPGIGVQERTGDIAEEAGQDDEIDMMLMQQLDDGFASGKNIPRERERGDTEATGTFVYTSLGIVRQNQGHINTFTVRKISDDIFGIRSVSGGKNGYIFHHKH